MNNPIFSISALCLSCFALLISSLLFLNSLEQESPTKKAEAQAVTSHSISTKKEISPEIRQLIQELVKQEVTKKTANLNVNSQSANVDADIEKLMKKHGDFIGPILLSNINKAVLKRVNKQLDEIDWEDKLSQKKLKKLLKNAARNTGFSSHNLTEIDVSDCDTTEKKIDKILKEFDGVNSYSHNNALVKQIIKMGDEAIPHLLEQLKKTKGHGSWAKRSALQDSLNSLLTEDHKEIILDEFEKNSSFAKLIKKYKFPEAEEMVLTKIEHPKHGHLDNNIIDAALAMNEEEAIPLLKNFIKTSKNPCYAAEQLANMRDVDITEELRSAALNVEYPWGQQQLSKVMLEKGMKEGLDLAYQVLTSTRQHSEYTKQQASNLMRKYTDAKGNYKDMAEWIKDNSEIVQWNNAEKRFE